VSRVGYSGSEIIEKMLNIYCCGDGETLQSIRGSSEYPGLILEFSQVISEIFSD